jgi:hypothetical protein
VLFSIGGAAFLRRLRPIKTLKNELL